MEASALRFERSFHGSLLYHVLSHLELGGDTASLFAPSLPPRAWVGGLLQAYKAAPARESIQFLAFDAPDLPSMLRLLQSPPERFGDADRRLAQALLNAIEDEHATFHRAWEANAQREQAHHARVASQIAVPLEVLRAALWSDGPVPPLKVLDCRSLRHHGRGSGARAEHQVAVSFAPPAERVLCLIFHEEVHAVSDSLVLSGVGGDVRETAVDRPGFVVHRMLEAAALEVGEAIIAARLPSLLNAYRAWRLGM